MTAFEPAGCAFALAVEVEFITSLNSAENPMALHILVFGKQITFPTLINSKLLVGD